MATILREKHPIGKWSGVWCWCRRVPEAKKNAALGFCQSGVPLIQNYFLWAQEMHRRWFESHLDGYDVQYANESRRYHGIGLSGPKSRELLARITRDDVSADGLKFRDIRRTFVGTVPAILARLSFSGELGYEIYVEPEYQLKLYEEICAAGEDLGLAHYGLRALMSLRLEKNWGAWTSCLRSKR